MISLTAGSLFSGRLAEDPLAFEFKLQDRKYCCKMTWQLSLPLSNESFILSIYCFGRQASSKVRFKEQSEVKSQQDLTPCDHIRHVGLLKEL